MAKFQQILSTRQEQRLELRPKMLQSLHLLSLPILELEVHLKQELVTNPMLEMVEDTPGAEGDLIPETEPDKHDDNGEDYQHTLNEARELSEILDQWQEYADDDKARYRSASDFSDDDEEGSSPEQYIRVRENKKDLFLAQLSRFDITDREFEFAADLVDSANDYGFLPADLDITKLAVDYNVEADRALEIHALILQLDPKGITARTIQECLIAQLEPEQLGNRILLGMIRDDFDDLIHRRYPQIASKYRITVEMVMHYRETISKLDPKPGLRLADDEIVYMVPDIIIQKLDDDFELIVNDSFVPRIGLSRNYRKIISSVKRDREALGYVRSKINSAKFLIKSMYLRNRTLERVTRSIIQHQRQFFYNETGILEPLTYATIAQELQVNESTISRVVRTKYAETPFGIRCLKDFFTSTAGKDRNYEAVSRQMVEKHIREMVEEEDKRSPISDQDIADILREKGISVSRRVIAKYREEMGILNSRLRKKE